MSRSGYLTRLLASSVFLLTCAPVWSEPAPADKPDTWTEVQTPHFIVATNDGENSARRVADQFEQIRFLYSAAFQRGIRIDPGIPILIFAVKNEKSLSQLIPEYWSQKGHTHPAGLFVPGPEKNYIALRTDVEGAFPYQPIYHEYVHLIENLNYQHLPTWLSEGFADFFGSATLGAKEGKLGQPNEDELYALSQSKLLPLELLFKVDQRSPYYNEANKTTIFYAESWALVHYLMTDPQKKKDMSLSKYLALAENGVDSLEAAKQAFGDLAQLQKVLQSYIVRNSYLEYVAPLPPKSGSKEYSARILSAAEAQARLGDFDLYRNQLDDARKKTEEAIRLDPNLPAAQETMGQVLFRQDKRYEADKYFSRAVELDSKSPLAYYYHAMLLMSQEVDLQNTADARSALEKAVALNPGLGFAWSNLSLLYAQDPGTLDKALAASKRAVDIVPGDPHFRYNLAAVLLRMERYDEARAIARNLQNSADPNVVSAAQRFLTQLDQAQQYTAYKRANEAAAPATPAINPETKSTDLPSSPVLRRRTPDETTATATSSAPASIDTPQVASARAYSMIGSIAEVNCAAPPQLQFTLKALTIAMHLHSSDFSKVAVKSAGANSVAKNPGCAGLRGRTARVTYQLVSDKPWDGEIVSIEFQENG